MPPKTANQNKRSGRMAKKGGQAVLQEEINSDDDWTKIIEKPGMYVVDVYTEWCGPCIPMTAYLKKIKLELGSENLHYAIAKSDNISVLKRFRQKSESHWLFFYDGQLVNIIIGTNAPRLMQLIVEELEQYVKFKNGEVQKEFIPLTQVTSEEQKKLNDSENYQKQKTRKEKKIRDYRMMKKREHSLKQFSVNIQMQTCVMFFPHTVKYIMVEKPIEDDAQELDKPPEPVMVEKRVCEVANSCATKYEELIVIEAKDVELTEDNLNELFFMEKEFLESFPKELVDQLLSKKVYSVMLSMPTIKQDTAPQEAVTEEENLPEPIDLMGVIEQKLSTIIYGNGTPLCPSPNSLADVHKKVNKSGQNLPSIYTPRNPLSKASALTILFSKFCQNNGYVAPLPPLPQYLVIFDINKSNIVLPIIEDLEEKVVYYGFFRSADPEKPKLLCKDPELLATYGMDRVGKDAKLVLSVLMDDKDKSLLRFVDVGPIYVSPDHETGIDDAIKFFPHDFDEMDGEVKLWLAQQEVRDEEATGVDVLGECDEGVMEEENPPSDQQQEPAQPTVVG
ncbi:thioredoxin domain-containing protein 3 homolog isoform X1 [Metopolophium dirhodum]|uniref:thioredoxin domain-containing protein 3 homolog isoform X1 n=2 Tax=Metopolophium dirhodum TaxID=44670 RepID=UPI00298FD77C|nr:thioredoxin domain-containing protein 3 homolog isoform X1 [Metopolophium dirhodum]